MSKGQYRVALAVLAVAGLLGGGCVPIGVLPSEQVEVSISNAGTARQLGSGFMASQPSPGNLYWYCQVTVKNVGKGKHHANPNNIMIETAEGFTYSYSPVTHLDVARGFPGVDVQPGSSATGMIVFEIPVQSPPTRLIYEPMFGTPVKVPLR